MELVVYKVYDRVWNAIYCDGNRIRSYEITVTLGAKKEDVEKIVLERVNRETQYSAESNIQNLTDALIKLVKKVIDKNQ